MIPHALYLFRPVSSRGSKVPSSFSKASTACGVTLSFSVVICTVTSGEAMNRSTSCGSFEFSLRPLKGPSHYLARQRQPLQVAIGQPRAVVGGFDHPGKPTDNALIEAFNGRFRSECLNAHWFLTLADARDPQGREAN